MKITLLILLSILFFLNLTSCIFSKSSKNSKNKPASVPVHIPRPTFIPVHRPGPYIVQVNRPVYHSGSRHHGQECTNSNSPLWICCLGVVQWKSPGSASTTACCRTKSYDIRYENCCIDGLVRRFC